MGFIFSGAESYPSACKEDNIVLKNI